MDKQQRVTVKLMNFLDRVDKLEYGSNFLWALQTCRMPTSIESAIWEFTGEHTFMQAIRALVRANTLRRGVKYPHIEQREISRLITEIDNKWTVRT